MKVSYEPVITEYGGTYFYRVTLGVSFSEHWTSPDVPLEAANRLDAVKEAIAKTRKLAEVLGG